MARPAAALILAIVTSGLVAACTATGGAGTSTEPTGSIRPGPSEPGRPTVPPSTVPVTGEVPEAVMDAVRADLSARTGIDASGATVVTAEAVAWPDGSLGCPQPGVMYIQVVTPGYHVVLSLEGTTYDYRVAGEGSVIRLCEGLKPAGAG
jgi:hypothetical protein